MPDLCHPGFTKGIQNHKGVTGFPKYDSFDSWRKEILGFSRSKVHVSEQRKVSRRHYTSGKKRSPASHLPFKQRGHPVRRLTVLWQMLTLFHGQQHTISSYGGVSVLLEVEKEVKSPASPLLHSEHPHYSPYFPSYALQCLALHS